MDLTKLNTRFQELYGEKKTHTFFAPGRINLIGEHLDYNGGYVLPAAITLGTYGLVRKRKDKTINLFSENFSELGVISFALTNLDYQAEDQWANYPKGVFKYLIEAGHPIDQGLDVVIYGNIPNGAGLSSSASLELLTGVMLENLFDLKVTRLELIEIGVKVENEFIGVNSGIMDQFIVGMGKKDEAILLNSKTLAYQRVPVDLKNHKIVIMNTKKRRELTSSDYNIRREECEQALAEMKNFVPINFLAEMDTKTFNQYKEQLSSAKLQKRVRHVVSENQRTLAAAEALAAGQLEKFGRLMNDSHISLRDDYEVTGIELDTLVEAAWEQSGVIGARMTGAGFGGSAIAIVADDSIHSFIENVGEKYQTMIGYPAEFEIAAIG